MDRIADPSLRYLVLDLIAQVKHLTSENRQLVSVTKLEIDCRTSLDRTIENKYPSFMDHEIDALKAAIDERFLEMQGWVKSDRGCIKDAQGKILFKNGWVNVIEKILSTNHV